MGSAKVWKLGETGAPKFSEDYEIVRRAVLQVTDIRSNHNKYYALELHAASGDASGFRLFTHYGRTDDLESNPNAGQKECRFFSSMQAALVEYTAIYRQKTSASKGYREVSLASSKIGSFKARGQSAGEVDAKTIELIAEPAKPEAPKPVSRLSPALARLVSYLYDEATGALTQTVAAKITAKGIETPLGVLTIGQLEKGEAILHDLYTEFQKPRHNREKMVSLSGDFYSVIPHRIGRTRSAIEASVINTMEAFEQKQETLQLMKDMLSVNGERGSVLHDENLDAKYDALRCELSAINDSSPAFQAIAEHVEKSQIRSKSVRVKHIYAVRRGDEWAAFRQDIDNQRLLLHGSRVKNWVGILSRGLVLPKIAVSMGVSRTDAGWLGNGIYFGDAACTSASYTTPGRHGTRFMAVARVALGRMKEFNKITYGITEAPSGYQSCRGVRAKSGVISQFSDDEYVVYDTKQQRIEYLVEFAALSDSCLVKRGSRSRFNVADVGEDGSHCHEDEDCAGRCEQERCQLDARVVRGGERDRGALRLDARLSHRRVGVADQLAWQHGRRAGRVYPELPALGHPDPGEGRDLAELWRLSAAGRGHLRPDGQAAPRLPDLDADDDRVSREHQRDVEHRARLLRGVSGDRCRKPQWRQHPLGGRAWARDRDRARLAYALRRADVDGIQPLSRSRVRGFQRGARGA